MISSWYFSLSPKIIILNNSTYSSNVLLLPHAERTILFASLLILLFADSIFLFVGLVVLLVLGLKINHIIFIMFFCLCPLLHIFRISCLFLLLFMIRLFCLLDMYCYFHQTTFIFLLVWFFVGIFRLFYFWIFCWHFTERDIWELNSVILNILIS